MTINKRHFMMRRAYGKEEIPYNVTLVHWKGHATF